MEIVKTSHQQNQYPSRSELEKMTNYELFEVASKSLRYKEVIVKFILSLEKKPIDVVYNEEDKYDIRKIGLSERLKNALLLGNFAYLTDLTVMRKSDLLRLRGLGITTLEELIKVMDHYGLKLVEK
jgi:DNA-directed RNA polymerase alpha subunit